MVHGLGYLGFQLRPKSLTCNQGFKGIRVGVLTFSFPSLMVCHTLFVDLRDENECLGLGFRA